MGKFAELHREATRCRQQRAEAEELLQEEDEEMAALAQEEKEAAEVAEEALLEDLVDLLVSDQADADRSVIIEIRPGTGGDEAALFAGDLLNMYMRYAETRGWKVEPMSLSSTDLGGMREAIINVSGPEVWQKLRYESGGHRVQRVPETESQGRIHTSMATVAVLPEADDVDVELDPNDLDVSFMRSSGPGGQSVNKTSSCVRIVHTPTGITVRCQDEKSQRANRKKAMKILRAKLYDKIAGEQQQERDALRRSQVGSGDRNERVRTYNFPQDRITDHRIGLDLFGIQNFLLGDCDRMFDALAAYDKTQRLKALADSAGSPPSANAD
jgi:peptide chain release factor 1